MPRACRPLGSSTFCSTRTASSAISAETPAAARNASIGFVEQRTASTTAARASTAIVVWPTIASSSSSSQTAKSRPSPADGLRTRTTFSRSASASTCAASALITTLETVRTSAGTRESSRRLVHPPPATTRRTSRSLAAFVKRQQRRRPSPPEPATSASYSPSPATHSCAANTAQARRADAPSSARAQRAASPCPARTEPGIAARPPEQEQLVVHRSGCAHAAAYRDRDGQGTPAAAAWVGPEEVRHRQSAPATSRRKTASACHEHVEIR